MFGRAVEEADCQAGRGCCGIGLVWRWCTGGCGRGVTGGQGSGADEGGFEAPFPAGLEGDLAGC